MRAHVVVVVVAVAFVAAFVVAVVVAAVVAVVVTAVLARRVPPSANANCAPLGRQSAGPLVA